MLFYLYINLKKALAGLVEIPAIALAIFIIMKLGKKWIFCATFFCAGLACFFVAVREGSSDMQWVKITLLMIGKTFYAKNKQININNDKTR